MRSPRVLAGGLAAVVCLAAVGPVSASDDWPDGYKLNHTYDEVHAELTQLAMDHPDIVRLQSMGRSYEGRQLWMVKISDNVAVDEPEPEVYVEGGIHAYEHTGTEQAMALVKWLADDYGTDARVTNIVNSTEIWVAPMVNPDGAMYDISGGVFHGWRKDRKLNADGTMGTDVNRNFGYRWGCCGHSSADPSSRYFRGLRAWSTPEARAVRDFVGSRVVGGVQQIRLSLDLHSHGEFVMYPFAYTAEGSPPDMRPGDLPRLQALAQGFADRDGYAAVQNGDLLAADGTFMDWAYARPRILTLTVELGPPSSVKDGRYVRDTDLMALLDNNRDAVFWFLEQAATVNDPSTRGRDPPLVRDRARRGPRPARNDQGTSWRSRSVEHPVTIRPDHNEVVGGQVHGTSCQRRNRSQVSSQPSSA